MSATKRMSKMKALVAYLRGSRLPVAHPEMTADFVWLVVPKFHRKRRRRMAGK